MSLSQDPVFHRLKNEFVCGTIDITGQPWTGFSGIHSIDDGAVRTTNGAGPHNIQIFVLAPDGTVLTCLPGYWHPEDLSHELDLAKELLHVWSDRSLTLAQKQAAFRERHLSHIEEHSSAMAKRSQMQGFDKKFEAKNRLENNDTIVASTGARDGGPIFKTTDVILHERIAKQPFRSYKSFDFVAFSDYGRAKYDKNEEGGLPAVDLRPQALEKKRLAEEKRRQQLANREAALARKRSQALPRLKRIRFSGIRIR